MKRLVLLFSLLPGLALAQSPAPTATAATSPSPSPADDSAQRARSVVASLQREVAHRTAEARGIYERGRFDSNLRPKIGSTMERAIAHVELQHGRVEAAIKALETGDAGALERLQEELEALADNADDEAQEISDVLTRGGETEDNLQRIASEIRAIGEKAEGLAEEIEEIIESREEDGGTVRFGDEHDYGGRGDRVRYGGGITVPKGETAKDVVAIWGPVIVDGDVQGDAVAIGGDVKVSASGHIGGDAVSVFGDVKVEPGGVIDGETVSVGAAGIGKRFAAGFAPSESFPVRMGRRFLSAGIRFIIFFLLGMLILAAIPERTENVARIIETEPAKVAGFGALLLIALLMVSVLLAVTIIGAVPLLLLVVPAAFAAMLFGYVGLALALGRRLKTGVVPTPLALFTIGAVLVVVVGLLPWPVRWLLWLVGICFALGAVVMTRFGNPASPSGPEPVAPA